MADIAASGVLTAAWDGITPAAPPAGSVVQLDTGRARLAGVEIGGTFTATVLIEGTFNGSAWFAANCTDLAAGAATNSLAAAGRRLVTCLAYAGVRARCSAFTSGSATVAIAGGP